jgi:hypothetical protein
MVANTQNPSEKTMSRRLYVMGAAAAALLALFMLYYLPSDIPAKTDQIYKVQNANINKGKLATLAELEEIMGRKADRVMRGPGAFIATRWSWVNDRTGERIDVEGMRPEEVWIIWPRPSPSLLDRLRTWLSSLGL